MLAYMYFIYYAPFRKCKAYRRDDQQTDFSFALRSKMKGEVLLAFILAQVIQSLCMHIFCCLVSFKNYAMQSLTI